MEGGLAACRSILLLQSFKKSMEGFFFWQDFLFLAKEYLAKDGGLAHAEAFCFCNPKKIQGGIFLGALRGIGGAAKPLP